MRIAYLECFAGISGDMFLGALLNAGVPRSVLTAAVAELPLGASLRIESVDRCGIAATKVHVLENGTLAEVSSPAHAHSHEHPHPHDDHGHSGTRSLTQIRSLIQSSNLSPAVTARALRTFELLGAAEAKIHDVPVDAIHFHEVGAVDAIVDIVLASAGIEYLNAQAVAETGQPLAWHSSALNVGGGMVKCAHGLFPVPAPATADLLRGMPTYSAHVQKELVTPTGAAILRALAPQFPSSDAPTPALQATRIGYGAGTRNPEGFPNVLRLMLGEAAATATAATGLPILPGTDHESLLVLETAIDDLSPQVLAYVAAKALTLGALDVTTTAATMKKGRAGTLLTLLCRDEHALALQQLLFTETTTLGLRIRREERISLPRTMHQVHTAFGVIAVKIATLDGKVASATPEFEDCRRAAEEHNVPLKRVQQAAQLAALQDEQKL